MALLCSKLLQPASPGVTVQLLKEMYTRSMSSAPFASVTVDISEAVPVLGISTGDMEAGNTGGELFIVKLEILLQGEPYDALL